MKKLSKKKNKKINEKIKYTIGFIILAITLYFISTIEFRPKKIACMKNSTVTSRQFLYKGELYIKIPKKLGITNLYCKN